MRKLYWGLVLVVFPIVATIVHPENHNPDPSPQFLESFSYYLVFGLIGGLLFRGLFFKTKKAESSEEKVQSSKPTQKSSGLLKRGLEVALVGVLGIVLFRPAQRLRSWIETPETATVPVGGLDAPFTASIPERFAAQLDSMSSRLSPTDRAELTKSIAFIGFSFLKQNPSFADSDEATLKARGLVVLYKIAKARGNVMTLRSYILFSDELKRQYPAWWQEYGEVVNGKNSE